MGPSSLGFWLSKLHPTALAADSWFKPHPFINEFSIVMALSQWLPIQTKNKSFIMRNGGATRPEDFSKASHAKEERYGPTSANQGISTDKPRHGHDVCTLRVHPPTSPVLPFLLAQNVSPKDTAGSDITIKLKICQLQLKSLVVKKVKVNLCWPFCYTPERFCVMFELSGR